MIKVLFITNILCRHQVGIWDPLSKKEDIVFTYLCTRDSNEEISLRYKCDEPRGYVVNSDSLSNNELSHLINQQNIIFYGSIEDKRVWNYVKGLDNAYIITENYSKQDYHELYMFRGLRRKLEFRIRIKKRLDDVNKQYIFCSSSHTGEDFRLAGASKKSTLKFGYFPHYNNTTLEDINSKDDKSIVYIGRNVDWKHPELAKYAYDIFNKYSSYNLYVYGEGLEKYFNDPKINVTQSINNKELIKILVKANVFIFPSDRCEGWGVVLGEALSSGCICFANKDAGSTRYLIKDKQNGFIFKNKRELRNKIKYFIHMDNEKIKQMRINASNTMYQEWSGECAAERLYTFIKLTVKRSRFIPFKAGPLSLD